MRAPEYDSHNDQFAAQLCCPWPGCATPQDADAPGDFELRVCPTCDRPFEVVRLEASPSLGGERPVVARRPASLFCAKTGAALRGPSSLDFDQAGGSPARTNTLLDAAGRVFGPPTRRTEWDFQLQWTQARWGEDEDEREHEAVTSVSVHRGTVVVASASGRVALFSAETGAPLLSRSLLFAGAPFDSTSREASLRLPLALRHAHFCAVTERFALFRDLTPSLFPHAPLSANAGAQSLFEPEGPLQLVAPPLITGGSGTLAPTVVLVEGIPTSPSDPPADAALRFFTLSGTPAGRLSLPDVVRPPVEIGPGLLATVNALGHVVLIDVATRTIVHHRLPDAMLRLSPTERPHLVFADGPQGGELWLADETEGSVAVWRASLDRIRGGAFSWEDRFASRGLGTLFSLAVGPVSPQRSHPASEHFVLATERSVAAYSRAMRHPAAEAVLSQPPLGPAVMTALGFLVQDAEGMWLRGMGSWSFLDDNLERRVRPAGTKPAPSLFDRTFAVFGRQVFFANGNTICGARLVPTSNAR